MATRKASSRPATQKARTKSAAGNASPARRPAAPRKARRSNPGAAEGAQQLQKYLDGDTFAIDTATTPPLHELGKTAAKYVRLGAKVKIAPGLIEALETSQTITYLQIHSANVLERAPRKTITASLGIEGAATRNLDFLEGFTELEELSIGSRQTSLADFSGVEACPKLEKLKAKQHLAKTLKPLASLENLREFIGPTAKNLTSLDGLTQETLLHVDVNLTPVRNLSPLSRAKGLLALKIRGCKVTSIEPILGCQRLQTLYAERSLLESIEGVGDSMKDLRLLWIGDTKVENIDALAGLGALLDLDLTGLKKVRDFSVLARLETVRYLNVFDSAFDDIGILESMPNLLRVQLGRARVSPKNSSVKKLNALLKKRSRQGGVFFEAIGAATSLSNSDAAYCSTSMDDNTVHNCF